MTGTANDLSSVAPSRPTETYRWRIFVLPPPSRISVAHKEARAAVQAGLALNPSFTVTRFRTGVSSDNPTYLTQRERLCVGMRIAGVPEG